jgi:hypothetical protein
VPTFSLEVIPAGSQVSSYLDRGLGRGHVRESKAFEAGVNFFFLSFLNVVPKPHSSTSAVKSCLTISLLEFQA